MPNESAGAAPAPLPAELIPDFERFRSALRAGGAGVASQLGAAGAASQSGSALLTSPQAEAGWREYGRLLHERSAALALIAKGDRGEVFTRHILDSLNPVALFDPPPTSLLDVGSGGGLPGIPLAIAWPDTRVVLLESRERKAGFLELAVRRLGLRHVRVVCARLEDLESQWREEPAGAVVVRAVGDLGRMLGLAAAVARPGARWVYFLGARAGEEVLPSESSFEARVVEGAFGGRLLTGIFPG
ncbi:MAG TPA: 16S rRNA (guanine(527)-N(7))-methyltransferase RsmG [Candidatus Binatia bacterium]|nr:16S rRNA (guanine(527)-N(7))-methyltransferase RsmG [Candidatus Binatia bacterium]